MGKKKQKRRERELRDDLARMFPNNIGLDCNALLYITEQYLNRWVDDWTSKRRQLDPDTWLNGIGAMAMAFCTTHQFGVDFRRACALVSESMPAEVRIPPERIEQQFTEHKDLVDLWCVVASAAKRV